MPKLEAYLALEATVAGTIAAVWNKRAKPIVARLNKALAAGDFARAFDLAAAITMHDVANAQRAKLEELAVSALLLGAARLVPMQQTALMTGALPLPPLLGPALDQLEKMVAAAGESVRKAALRVIEAAEDAAKQPALAIKAEDDFADKLNAAVLGTGKGLIAVGANLTTSRLVSYGFLGQAQELELDAYQVTEVLDTRVCPVCETMHGKEFAVRREFARLEQVLQIQDPAELKSAAPWPKQDEASIKALRVMSEAQIQSRGWGSPPYHPLCRGQLVPLGTVEAAVPAKELIVEQEVESPTQI
jgi:hypothetical protein